MQQAYITTGSLTDARTVALDEPLPISQGTVRVTVEVVSHQEKSDLSSFLENLWEQQRQRGHVPPSREEVDAHVRAERDSWDD
jgi:hypothetical protein